VIFYYLQLRRFEQITRQHETVNSITRLRIFELVSINKGAIQLLNSTRWASGRMKGGEK